MRVIKLSSGSGFYCYCMHLICEEIEIFLYSKVSVNSNIALNHLTRSDVWRKSFWSGERQTMQQGIQF